MTTELKNLIYTTSVFGLITLGSIWSYEGIPGRDNSNVSPVFAQQGGTTGGTNNNNGMNGVDRTPQPITSPAGTGSGGQGTEDLNSRQGSGNSTRTNQNTGTQNGRSTDTEKANKAGVRTQENEATQSGGAGNRTGPNPKMNTSKKMMKNKTGKHPNEVPNRIDNTTRGSGATGTQRDTLK